MMMKRMVKYLIPMSMMLMVAAVPSDSFAAEPGQNEALMKTGANTYQAQAFVRQQTGRKQVTAQELKEMMEKAKEVCDLAKSGELNPLELFQHLFDGDCGTHPDTPEQPNVPDMPDVPDVEEPEQPNVPDVPDVEEPEQPNVPDVPDVEEPEQPNVPDVPDVEEPEQPNVPDVPNRPNVPDQDQGGNDQNQGSIGAYESQVVALVNQERAAQGLSALKINTKLSQVAELKAEDLRDLGYFSHTSPTYGSPFDMMKQFGISYTSAGENIAKGQKTPDSVMNGWMNSQGHRENILNANYTEIGVGYVTDRNGGTYWVQMFIRP